MFEAVMHFAETYGVSADEAVASYCLLSWGILFAVGFGVVWIADGGRCAYKCFKRLVMNLLAKRNK